MSKIHTQNLINDKGYCFFDAGEIELSFIDKFSLRVYKKDTLIFHTRTHPCKVYFLEGVSAIYDDISAFDIDLTREYPQLVCFDPRIVMTFTLLAWILDKEGFNEFLEIEDLYRALTPLPTMDEAKTFLKKNKTLIDEPIYDAHLENRLELEDLIDIPAKVRKLFEK